MIEVQTTLVAGPRNQRYLHPRLLGAGVFVCEVQEGSKFSIELHPELSIFRHEPDLFDELRQGQFWYSMAPVCRSTFSRCTSESSIVTTSAVMVPSSDLMSPTFSRLLPRRSSCAAR